MPRPVAGRPQGGPLDRPGGFLDFDPLRKEHLHCHEQTAQQLFRASLNKSSHREGFKREVTEDIDPSKHSETLTQPYIRRWGYNLRNL